MPVKIVEERKAEGGNGERGKPTVAPVSTSSAFNHLRPYIALEQ